jgi:hypothetical protein
VIEEKKTEDSLESLSSLTLQMVFLIRLSPTTSSATPSTKVVRSAYNLDLGNGYTAWVTAEILNLPKGKFVRLPMVEPGTLVAEVASTYFR